MIFRLPEDEIVFPNPALAEEDGLLAIGGDLSVDRLLLAYRNGIFPWFSEDDPICWYSPHERCVIYPEQVKVSKSMEKVITKGQFTVSYNQAFQAVIENCARVGRRDQPGTWITKEMQEAYIALQRHGHAASVEVWMEDELVGGLYGVLINRVFCGESMFSLASNASKTALIWLCRTGRFSMIDCQLANDHLMSLGAQMISRAEYMKVLGD
jgi:leucyl/phenylalanyl-tRNA--protein transferase